MINTPSSSVRVSNSATVVAEAEKIIRLIGARLLTENLTEAQIHEMADNDDPLKAFGEACRAEPDAIDIDR